MVVGIFRDGWAGRFYSLFVVPTSCQLSSHSHKFHSAAARNLETSQDNPLHQDITAPPLSKR